MLHGTADQADECDANGWNEAIILVAPWPMSVAVFVPDNVINLFGLEMTTEFLYASEDNWYPRADIVMILHLPHVSRPDIKTDRHAEAI